MKKISVCIPTYNCLKLIEPTLKSVYKQTYENFEVVICNDSPNDHKKVSEYLKKYDKRINLYLNKKNFGYPKNISQCVKKASGEIIFLLGQDDIILSKNHFKNIIEIFASNQNIKSITRGYYWFYGNNTNSPIRQINPVKEKLISLSSSEDTISTYIDTIGQLSGLSFYRCAGKNIFT